MFHDHDDPDWQPATSAPGELLTPAGRLRAQGAFLRNLRRSTPRHREHRRAMRRPAWFFLALAAIVLALTVVL